MRLNLDLDRLKFGLNRGLKLGRLEFTPKTILIAVGVVAVSFFVSLKGMDWLTPERAEVSSDPRALLPGARSVVALGVFYLTNAPRDLSAPSAPSQTPNPPLVGGFGTSRDC